jgi:glycolate oxidase iron-sulfur subunit
MAPETTSSRIVALADQCVQCGLCLPVCPTYALDEHEAESPRGRIALAKALAEGRAQATSALRLPIDHCLGCLNCERVCPAEVRYESLLVETRALLGPSPRRPNRLLALAKRPRLYRWLQRLARRTRAAAWFPGGADSSLRAALQLVPRTDDAPARLPTIGRAVNVQAAVQATTLALFPGCVASVQDAAAEQAAERLLHAAGYRVHRLPAFCCGALDRHDGATKAAAAAIERVRAAWAEAAADALVTVTPGCLNTLREALPQVRVDDPYRWLAERIDALRFRPLPLKAALHVPCTQTNVARSEAPLMQLLQRVPGLEVRRLTPPPYCCGAAGSHVLQFPQRAARLRDELLAQSRTLDVQLVLSSNIGCRMHIDAGQAGASRPLPSLHPLTLLAQQWEP